MIHLVGFGTLTPQPCILWRFRAGVRGGAHNNHQNSKKKKKILKATASRFVQGLFVGGLKCGELSWGPYDCGLSDDIVGFRV